VSAWYVAAFVLMVGGIAPALVIGARGGPIDRLVGLELVSSVTVLTMLVLAQAFAQPSYLVVPLVLAVLAITGTLVFTRLLGPR
jgi:multisubunit Na+/H+ antiporter MnhF subunit